MEIWKWVLLVAVLLLFICGAAAHKTQHEFRVPMPVEYDDGYLAGVLKAMKSQEETREQAHH